MKKEIKSLFIYFLLMYLLAMAIIFIYSHFFKNNIEGQRGRGISTIHVNEGPHRIGGDYRFSNTGVNISTNVYGQNSYCANNPQSTPCKPK